MKILAVTPRYDIFPVGIAIVAAALQQAGHQVDGLVYREPEALLERLRTHSYDFVATGGLSSQSLKLKEICRIASGARVRTIVGGGIITSEPDLMCNFLAPDFSVLGEGEITAVELLSCIEKGGNIETVQGIGFRHEGKYHFTPPRPPIADINSVPQPALDIFEFSAYLDRMEPTHSYYDLFDFPRDYPLITSRSCPFDCTFCYHPNGQKYRQRSLDSLLRELETVVPRYRINIVAMWDELFAYDEARVLEFCRRFKEFTRTIPWEIRWFCSLRVDMVTEPILDALRDSGCFMIGYGFESYHPDVLKSMKKKTTPEQIDRAIRLTLARKISIQGNFIFGDRAETLETARHTLEFWRHHRDTGILLTFIIPCPDSEMYRHAQKCGVIKDRLEFINHHLFEVVNMTAMSDSDFQELRAMVSAYTHRYSVYSIPLRKSDSTVVIRCPYCKTVSKYGNYRVHPFFFLHMMHCRLCRKRFFNVSALYKMFARIAGVLFTPTMYRFFLACKEKAGFISPRSIFKDFVKESRQPHS